MNVENMVFASEENKEEFFDLDIRVYSKMNEGDGFFTMPLDVFSIAGCVTGHCAEGSIQ